jgi:hypothetical protein
MRRVAAGALLALALIAAGCGGTTSSLSEGGFGSKLNRICADYNAKVTEIGAPNSLAELASKGPALIGEFDKAIVKADDLSRRMRSSTADRFISESKQLRDILNRLIDAAKKSDTATITQLGSQADALSKDADALGAELGAPACAQG